MNKKLNIGFSSILLSCCFVVLLVSCKKNDPAPPVKLTIGQSYQGGIVAYILVPGDPGYDSKVQHGLIAAQVDQSAGIVWWNGNFTTTAATAMALGTGNDNTSTIVASQGAGNYAAKICYDLVQGGYSDWFLPSKDELKKLYLNRVAIGGFSAVYYWNSSEISSELAYDFLFTDGHEDPSYYWNGSKSFKYNVRAVRTF